MATSNKGAWRAIQSHLAKMGYGKTVMIGEPRSDAQTRMIAIVPQGGDIDSTTLFSPRERHSVVLRYYINWNEQPQEDTEFELDQFRADIQEDIFGDFALGGNIAYALPPELDWEFGEAVVGNTLYRTLELRAAYRIDDRATFAA